MAPRGAGFPWWKVSSILNVCVTETATHAAAPSPAQKSAKSSGAKAAVPAKKSATPVQTAVAVEDRSRQAALAGI
jgi:hypothetical protein